MLPAPGQPALSRPLAAHFLPNRNHLPILCILAFGPCIASGSLQWKAHPTRYNATCSITASSELFDWPSRTWQWYEPYRSAYWQGNVLRSIDTVIPCRVSGLSVLNPVIVDGDSGEKPMLPQTLPYAYLGIVFTSPSILSPARSAPEAGGKALWFPLRAPWETNRRICVETTALLASQPSFPCSFKLTAGEADAGGGAGTAEPEMIFVGANVPPQRHAPWIFSTCMLLAGAAAVASLRTLGLEDMAELKAAGQPTQPAQASVPSA